MPYLLGTDNGCTVAKAALFTLDGREVAVASRKIDAVAPRPGWMEVDMQRSWQATADSIRAVIAQAAIDPKEVLCVASAGHGNGLYLIDRDGQPVRNAIGSADQRARTYIDRWLADGVGETVRTKTMQSLWPGQPNALLRWLMDYEPEPLARAAWVLMCKDYQRFRLTGRPLAELTDMSGTSLMDVGRQQYDDAVLRAFGLESLRDCLPPLVRSAEICGTVTPAAAAETGLATGTPVAGGLFDIDACALASGVIDSTQLALTAGTWSVNQYIDRTPATDLFMTSCYAIPGYYLMLEGSPTSASNLEWFVTELMPAEQRQAAERGGSVFELVNELVSATPVDESGPVFLPFLYGSSVGPDAKAGFLGLTGWQNRGHLLRAIFEGVVFGHRLHVERMARHRPEPAKTIRLTGGAARSAPWRQVFADAFQTPVEVPAGTELGALGAAICAAVAAGVYRDFPSAVAAMVRIDRVQPPDPRKRDLYEARYARFRRLIAALEEQRSS